MAAICVGVGVRVYTHCVTNDPRVARRFALFSDLSHLGNTTTFFRVWVANVITIAIIGSCVFSNEVEVL